MALDSYARQVAYSDWFPVRITAASGDGYLFVECRNLPDGDNDDLDGGRTATADTLAYPLVEGQTFAADEIALARVAPGATPEWELVKVSSSSSGGGPPAGGGPPGGCGWFAGLTSTSCVSWEIGYRGGICTSVAVQSGTLPGASPTTWVGATDLITDDLTGPLTLTRATGNVPSLTMTDGVTTYTFAHMGCEDGKLVFAGGGSPVCLDDAGDAPVECEDYFTVLISCSCPPPDTVPVVCAAHEIPSVLYAHLVLTATGCGFDVNLPLTYGAVPDLTTGWAGTFTAGGCGWSFGVQCVSGTDWAWSLRNEETATGDGGTTAAVTSDPELTLSDSQGASVLGVGETCCTYGGGGITIAFDVTE